MRVDTPKRFPTRWSRLGRIYVPRGDREWSRSHAANPAVELLDGDVFRVYFGTRDGERRSSIAWFNLELGDKPRVVSEADEPLLRPGTPGTFDDSGCGMGCVVRVGDALHLYYMGWNLGVTVPWRNSIGLAISPGEGAPFERISLAPIMDRHLLDPFSLSYPWVLAETSRYRIWYGSNLSWGRQERDMYHVVKHAESENGIDNWQRTPEVCVGGSSPEEFAVCRPCVVRAGDRYRMWYCSRGETYRIRSADSDDGLVWRRNRPDVELPPSHEEWDCDMDCYPCVFAHKGRWYMLYNGNRYGATGIGLAVGVID
jgi:hypothetical protein